MGERTEIPHADAPTAENGHPSAIQIRILATEISKAEEDLARAETIAAERRLRLERLKEHWRGLGLLGR